MKFGGGGGGGGGAKRQRHRFSVAALEADLSSGSLLVHARSDEVAQAICLAFSIAMLQVRALSVNDRKGIAEIRTISAMFLMMIMAEMFFMRGWLPRRGTDNNIINKFRI